VPTDQRILRVYETGPTTVVGFVNQDLLSELRIEECREEMTALIQQHQCRELVFDVSRLQYVPSSLLGMMVALRKLNVEVVLSNPSIEVREILKITNLDRVLTIRDSAT